MNRTTFQLRLGTFKLIAASTAACIIRESCVYLTSWFFLTMFQKTYPMILNASNLLSLSRASKKSYRADKILLLRLVVPWLHVCSLSHAVQDY